MGSFGKFEDRHPKVENNSFLEKARGLEVSSFTLFFLGGAPQTPFLGLADGISYAQVCDCIPPIVQHSRFRFAALELV